MTRSFYLFALLCVFSLNLFTPTLTQGVDPIDLDWNFGNEEWDVNENWENEECYWEEEMIFDTDGGLVVPVDNAVTAGKTVNCEQQYAIIEGDICDNIAQANGVSVDDLKNLNDGLNCDALQIGQNICVKGTVQEDPVAPPAEPPAQGGAINISFEQFTKAVTKTNNYPAPTQEQYNSFINNYAKGDISTPRELAMFLSEILWESGGLQFKAEIRCQTDGCPNDYRTDGDDPAKFYYGRGYIQLTWSDNYRQASQALFGDDRLVQDPDQVANNEDVAWQTAFWYWKDKVHIAPGVQDGQFGSATNAINGQLECNPCQGNCSKRNDIYAAVLPEFGVNEQPNFAGC